MIPYNTIHLNQRLYAYSTAVPDTWLAAPQIVASPERTTLASRWPELMCISTLAEYLDMSVSSVRSLINDGDLPDATNASRPRLKRWKRSVVDDALQRVADRKAAHGLSMTDALKKAHSKTTGGR